MEEFHESKVKPPKGKDEPPLRQPFFISKRKSKSLESQIQGVLLRFAIELGYDIVIKKPKIAEKSLPFLTILALKRDGVYIDFKTRLEEHCKALQDDKLQSGAYPQHKLLKYTQRNRIALTCNWLLRLLEEDGFRVSHKRSKESVETVQLQKFSEIWNSRLGVRLDEEQIVRIGQDMISFVVETFTRSNDAMLVFGRSFLYGFQRVPPPPKAVERRLI